MKIVHKAMTNAFTATKKIKHRTWVKMQTRDNAVNGKKNAESYHFKTHTQFVPTLAGTLQYHTHTHTQNEFSMQIERFEYAVLQRRLTAGIGCLVALPMVREKNYISQTKRFSYFIIIFGSVLHRPSHRRRCCLQPASQMHPVQAAAHRTEKTHGFPDSIQSHFTCAKCVNSNNRGRTRN